MRMFTPASTFRQRVRPVRKLHDVALRESYWSSSRKILLLGRAGLSTGAEAMVAATAAEAVTLWSAPEGDDGAEPLGSLPLRAGDRFPLLAVDAGIEGSEGTSAEAYRLWYRIGLANGEDTWVQAAVPTFDETGGDSRPSSVRFEFLPAIVGP